MRTGLLILFSLGTLIGSAQFTSPIELDLDVDFESLAVGSSIAYDEDSADELLIFDISLAEFYIVDDVDGNASIIETVTSDSYSQITSAKAFDADNDGDDDILVMSNQGLFLYTREEDNSLVENDLPGTNFFRVFELFDVNEDGFLDIIGLNTSNSLIRVYYSNGPASFQASTLATNECQNAKDFTIVDDGVLRGIVFPQNTSNALAYVPFAGNQSFGEVEVLIENPLEIEAIEAADLTGDGSEELVLATNDRILYLKNQNDGSFANPYIVKFINDVRDVILKDVTGDEMNDIIYVKDDFLDRVIMFENINNGFFFQSATFDAPNIQTVVFGDFDNNGMPDLAADAWRGSDRLGIAFNLNPDMNGLIENAFSNPDDAVDLPAVYPNPVVEQFRISNTAVFDDKSVSITIFDLQGRPVKQLTGVSVRNQFDVSSLKTGIYLISVSNDVSGRTQSMTFSKL